MGDFGTSAHPRPSLRCELQPTARCLATRFSDSRPPDGACPRACTRTACSRPYGFSRAFLLIRAVRMRRASFGAPESCPDGGPSGLEPAATCPAAPGLFAARPRWQRQTMIKSIIGQAKIDIHHNMRYKKSRPNFGVAAARSAGHKKAPRGRGRRDWKDVQGISGITLYGRRENVPGPRRI